VRRLAADAKYSSEKATMRDPNGADIRSERTLACVEVNEKVETNQGK